MFQYVDVISQKRSQENEEVEKVDHREEKEQKKVKLTQVRASHILAKHNESRKPSSWREV